MPLMYHALLLAIGLFRIAEGLADNEIPEHYQIVDRILKGYNRDMIPKFMNRSVDVKFSMELYQIIEVNEPQQYLMLNSWIVERWVDVMLGWNPEDFEGTSEIVLPHSKIWLPDTTLYNSYVTSGAIGTTNCIENEGWNVLRTEVERKENKYDCCPNNYTLLTFAIHIQRKPLYYVINLILPTSIITIISIVGFFSSSSPHEVRQEKITLGITTLLSMSILILMVSDKMPSTSSFIPLIGWFYTAMISLISVATIFASLVIWIQKKGIVGTAPPPKLMWWARLVGRRVYLELPLLMKQAYARKAAEEKARNAGRKPSLWQKVYKMSRTSNIFTTTQTQKVVNAFGNQNGAAARPMKPKSFPNLANVSAMKGASEPPVQKKSLAFSIDDRDFDPEDRPSPPKDNTPMIDDEEAPEDIIRKYKPAKQLRSSASIASYDNLFRNFEPGPGMGSAAPTNTERRNLAQLEYDWLAAVFERICLLVFIVLFLFMSVGINMLGWYYWKNAEYKLLRISA
ncbi:unnamed protein product, partial [Mesorhabditis spiculigera]